MVAVLGSPRLAEGRDASERLLWMPPEEDLAATLRQKQLPRAGVDRAELFETQQRVSPARGPFST
jgi:hypothetical protein